MNFLDPIEQRADDISMNFIETLVKEAGGDEFKLLAAIDSGLRASRRHQERLKALRLEQMTAMRNAGVPNTEIAEAANVNDSYVSRLAIEGGAKRIVDRTRPRRRRRPPPQGRTA